MFIHDPPKPNARKELKVNLTARQHRNLRAIQGTTGLETPHIIKEALEVYFQHLAAKARGRGS